MPINALRTLWRTIQFHGGLRKSVMSGFVRDSLKIGQLVGEDKYGNKYYENNDYFLGRNRWVHYADRVFLNYDASQVPPEWHGWLHHRTDLLPHQEAHRPQHPWMAPHEENMSGTPEQYVPYSTTLPKVSAWEPPPHQQKGRLDEPPTDNGHPSTSIKCTPERKDPTYRAFH